MKINNFLPIFGGKFHSDIRISIGVLPLFSSTIHLTTFRLFFVCGMEFNNKNSTMLCYCINVSDNSADNFYNIYFVDRKLYSVFRVFFFSFKV